MTSWKSSRRLSRLPSAAGWRGVDLLVGAETRPHRDLDLAVNVDEYTRWMTTLEGLGYIIETDWLPLRVELAASGERWMERPPRPI
jgi:lincosamide nucleotidyltransferase A/C/D/E